jgi:hypothetical protein
MRLRSFPKLLAPLVLLSSCDSPTNHPSGDFLYLDSSPTNHLARHETPSLTTDFWERNGRVSEIVFTPNERTIAYLELDRFLQPRTIVNEAGFISHVESIENGVATVKYITPQREEFRKRINLDASLSISLRSRSLRSSECSTLEEIWEFGCDLGAKTRIITAAACVVGGVADIITVPDPGVETLVGCAFGYASSEEIYNELCSGSPDCDDALYRYMESTTPRELPQLKGLEDLGIEPLPAPTPRPTPSPTTQPTPFPNTRPLYFEADTAFASDFLSSEESHTYSFFLSSPATVSYSIKSSAPNTLWGEIEYLADCDNTSWSTAFGYFPNLEDNIAREGEQNVERGTHCFRVSQFSGINDEYPGHVGSYEFALEKK